MVAIYAIVFTYAVIAAPFVLSGVAVCLALTRFPRDIGRLYAFDLVGAALGCVLLVVAAGHHRRPRRRAASSAPSPRSAALLFALDGGSARWRKLGVASFVVLTLAASGHTVLVWHEFPVFRILYVKAGFEARAALREVELVLARARGRQSRAAGEALRLGPQPHLARRIGWSSSSTWTSTSPPAPC